MFEYIVSHFYDYQTKELMVRVETTEETVILKSAQLPCQKKIK